jgi:hypothetical protein
VAIAFVRSVLKTNSRQLAGISPAPAGGAAFTTTDRFDLGSGWATHGLSCGMIAKILLRRWL